jgi:hypothetical protein
LSISAWSITSADDGAAGHFVLAVAEIEAEQERRR